jgi:hypothetical protein
MTFDEIKADFSQGKLARRSSEPPDRYYYMKDGIMYHVVPRNHETVHQPQHLWPTGYAEFAMTQSDWEWFNG